MQIENQKHTNYLILVSWPLPIMFILLLMRDPLSLNSLTPGRFQRNSNEVIFQLILVIDGWSIFRKIVLKWMPMDLTDGK